MLKGLKEDKEIISKLGLAINKLKKIKSSFRQHFNLFKVH